MKIHIVSLSAVLLISFFVSAQPQNNSRRDVIVEVHGNDTIWAEKPYLGADSIRYHYVEKTPRFNGSLNEYMKKNLRYPLDAKRKKIEGTVVVNFIITKSGTIINPHIVHPIYPSLDAEALLLISKMPRWIPAEMPAGSPIDIQYAMPVVFKLYLAGIE